MEKNKNIENSIITIIKSLDEKIKNKHNEFKKQKFEKNTLQKELSTMQLQLMRLQLLKESLLSKNHTKINAYNAKQTNEKNKLRPNYNRLISGNTSSIESQILEKENEIRRITQELSNKSAKVEDLTIKMNKMIDLLGKLSKKVRNNSNAQKQMINNIYKSTRIKSVLKILNSYYGNHPKPNRNISPNQLL